MPKAKGMFAKYFRAAMISGKSSSGDQQLLATVDEACEALNIGRSSMYELINDGTLRLIKIRGASRIPWDDIRRVADGTE